MFIRHIITSTLTYSPSTLWREMRLIIPQGISKGSRVLCKILMRVLEIEIGNLQVQIATQHKSIDFEWIYIDSYCANDTRPIYNYNYKFIWSYVTTKINNPRVYWLGRLFKQRKYLVFSDSSVDAHNRHSGIKETLNNYCCAG